MDDSFFRARPSTNDRGFELMGWKKNQCFFESFMCALKGGGFLFRYEKNFRLQLVVGGGVLIISWWLSISVIEWMWVIFLIGMVLVFECINTIIESILDFISPSYNDIVGEIKDVAAFTVLLVSIVSGCIGILIFFPKLYLKFNNSLLIDFFQN